MEKRVQTRKWLICHPQARVSEVAFVALSQRLAGIAGLLDKAARCAKCDVEHVHRLRVATRRADAAVQLFGQFAKTKYAHRMSGYLAEIRKAAGRARDLDVLIQRCEARQRHHVESLVRRRKQAQKRIMRARYKFLASGRLEKCRLKLLRSMPLDGETLGRESFADWSHGQLSLVATRFFEAWPSSADDPDALHRFRIQGKALRYVIELVACVFPVTLRDAIYPQIESLQDVLGRINDHNVACGRLANWTGDQKKAPLANVLQEEQHSLREAISEFERRWMVGQRDELLAKFQELLGRESMKSSATSQLEPALSEN